MIDEYDRGDTEMLPVYYLGREIREMIQHGSNAASVLAETESIAGQYTTEDRGLNPLLLALVRLNDLTLILLRPSID